MLEPRNSCNFLALQNNLVHFAFHLLYARYPAQECPLFERSKYNATIQAAMVTIRGRSQESRQIKCKWMHFVRVHWCDYRRGIRMVAVLVHDT